MMTDRVPIVNSEMAAACYGLLRASASPMTAAKIAESLGMGGCRETQRRHVRAIIKRLREAGCRVVADNKDGYQLTADDGLYARYLELQKRRATRRIGEAHGRQMACYAGGQGALFGPVVCVGIG